MRELIEKHLRKPDQKYTDHVIGNIILSQPFFFARDAWIPVPSDWKPNIVIGKIYNLDIEPGRSLWTAVQERLADVPIKHWEGVKVPRYGPPVLIAPRLGQGGFRVLVTDAYEKRCAVTGERTLPVLEAAHIRPYSDGGEHELTNGILFRSDIHTLVDKGFVTVGPDYRFEVSKRIREDFENRRDYYKLAGTRLLIPQDPRNCPDIQQLRWHNEEKFLG